MKELTELSVSIKLFGELGMRMLNIGGSTGVRYRDMLWNIDEKILELDKLINEINSDLFKITSKTEGLYLKDLTGMSSDFIEQKYHDITNQVNLVNRDDKYQNKKLHNINRKFENLEAKVKETIESIDKFNRGISELIKLEERLKKEFTNSELIDETIIYLSHKLNLFER